VIILRFVHCKDPFSDAVLLRTGGLFSHVEALSHNQYIGAHVLGGVQARPPGYDKAFCDRERFALLKVDDFAEARFYSCIEGAVGEPYDFKAIAGITLNMDLHAKACIVCSALHTLGLIAANFFPRDLSVPFYQISPRDLELILSARDDVVFAPTIDLVSLL